MRSGRLANMRCSTLHVRHMQMTMTNIAAQTWGEPLLAQIRDEAIACRQPPRGDLAPRDLTLRDRRRAFTARTLCLRTKMRETAPASPGLAQDAFAACRPLNQHSPPPMLLIEPRHAQSGNERQQRRRTSTYALARTHVKQHLAHPRTAASREDTRAGDGW